MKVIFIHHPFEETAVNRLQLLSLSTNITVMQYFISWNKSDSSLLFTFLFNLVEKARIKRDTYHTCVINETVYLNALIFLHVTEAFWWGLNAAIGSSEATWIKHQTDVKLIIYRPVLPIQKHLLKKISTDNRMQLGLVWFTAVYSNCSFYCENEHL